MTEKIKKLIFSNNYEDVYIGLRLFENWTKTEQLRFLKNNFIRGSGTYSWRIICQLQNVPRDIGDKYIIGKYYSYVVQYGQIMIDTPCIFRKFTRATRKRDQFKILETWM